MVGVAIPRLPAAAQYRADGVDYLVMDISQNGVPDKWLTVRCLRC